MTGIDEFSPSFNSAQLFSKVGSSQAMQMASGVTLGIAPVVLTPGIWDVSGGVAFKGGGAALIGDYSARIYDDVNLAGNGGNLNIDIFGVVAKYPQSTPPLGINIGDALPSIRFVVQAGSTLTVRAYAVAHFSGGVLKLYGHVTANRVA